MPIRTPGKWLLATMLIVSTAAADVTGLEGSAWRAVADNDGDSVGDNVDNCLMLANPNQRDTDADGIGNACDPDLNNDCMVNFIDLQIIKSVFFGSDANADFNGDGTVNFLDLLVMKNHFFSAPGSSGGQNICTCTPPEAVPQLPNLEFNGQEMFLLGGLSQNGLAVPGVNNFSDQDGGLYLARVFAQAGGTFDFTISDQASAIEYCAENMLAPYAFVDLPYFGCATAGTVQIPGPGCYEFAMRAEPGSILPASVALTLAERLGRWEFVVDANGGLFSAPNGVELEIPPGAVAGPVSLKVGDVACEQVDALFAATTVSTHDNRCIGAFAGEPDEFVFDAPVTARLPVTGLTPSQEIPLWLTSATGRQDYSLIPTTLTYRGDLAVVEATLDHFSIVASAAATNLAPPATRDVDLPPCCSATPTPVDCCCTTFSSTSAAGDTVGTDCDCQLLGFEIETVFPNCPGSPVFMDSESHSSENCPTDFQATISPTDLTIWTCEDRDIEAQLTGTNQNGSDCNLPLPVNWSTGNSGIATVADIGPNMARVTGVTGGPTSINATSLVGTQFSVSTPLEVVSLSGEWYAAEEGEQSCSGSGQPYSEEDSDEGYVEISQTDCDTISVDLGIPGVGPSTGTLIKTGDPVFPFTFQLSSTGTTLGCYLFNSTASLDTGFGSPLCPIDYTCVAGSCSETTVENGTIGQAILGSGLGSSNWDFSASWTETIVIDGEVFTFNQNVNCIGSSVFLFLKE